jgi:hypothetical protein
MNIVVKVAHKMTYHPKSKRFNPLLSDPEPRVESFTSQYPVKLYVSPPFVIHNVSAPDRRGLAEDNIRERFGNIPIFLDLKLGGEFDKAVNLIKLRLGTGSHHEQSYVSDKKTRHRQGGIRKQREKPAGNYDVLCQRFLGASGGFKEFQGCGRKGVCGRCVMVEIL